MKISTITIALLVFSLLVIGMSTAYYDISASYEVTNITNSTNMTAFLDSTAGLNTKMNKIKDTLTDVSNRFPLDPRNVYDVTTLFLNVPGMLLEIPNIIDSVVQGVVMLLPVGNISWFTTGLTAIIVAVFVFKALGFVRREP